MNRLNKTFIQRLDEAELFLPKFTESYFAEYAHTCSQNSKQSLSSTKLCHLVLLSCACVYNK